METVRLNKRKRPGGLHHFDLRPVRQDRDGVWLAGPIGSPWAAPHDTGTLPVPVIVLLAPDRPWAAWWVDEPGDPRLEIDICPPPSEERAEALRRCDEPWQPEGWRLLAQMPALLSRRELSRARISSPDRPPPGGAGG